MSWHCIAFIKLKIIMMLRRRARLDAELREKASDGSHVTPFGGTKL